MGWLAAYEAWMWWLGAGSAAMFVATIAAGPVVAAWIPADYFVRGPGVRRDGHVGWRIALRVARNALGAVLVVAGVAMLVLPGQGLVTMLLGVMLLDLPGKRRVEVWLIRRRPIARAIDWLRARRGRPPLLLPPP